MEISKNSGKMLVFMVFSYIENVITRRNYHLFKSFLIKANQNGLFCTQKLIRKHAFSAICKNASNFSKDDLF